MDLLNTNYYHSDSDQDEHEDSDVVVAAAAATTTTPAHNRADEAAEDMSSTDIVQQQQQQQQEELQPVVAFIPVAQRVDRTVHNAAPSVPLTAWRSIATANNNSNSTTALSIYAGPTAATTGPKLSKPKAGESRKLVLAMNNPTKDILYQPILGPQQQVATTTAGVVAPAIIQANIAFDEAAFAEQRVSFQRSGRALAPNDVGSEIVRTTWGYEPKRLEIMAQKEEERRKRPRPDEAYTIQQQRQGGEAGAAAATNAVAITTKDELVEGSDDEATYGVWGPPGREERWHADNTLSDLARGGIESLAPEQLAEREYIKERDRQRGAADESREQMSSFERLVERKMAHLLPPRMESEVPMEASTTFHGTEEFDYKGRSWIAPPSGMGTITANNPTTLEMDHHRCYVPKKCVHKFTGHTKGVHRIRLYPGTGHLILSAGLDGLCKVYSIEYRQVMRTYAGHTAGVRDVQFNHSGTRFVSASFDRFLRLWDTESGQVLQTFTNKKVPYVVKFYPHDDNFFVVGCSDNKIVTYNATTAEITQEYNSHQAPVNAILFVEDHGTKMITSSDDKKILIWEWDIGVPIKYISDPAMHSMPTLALHPSKLFFVGQSLDNKIAVFQAHNRFALQRKKAFTGHIVSGYACEMAFSPDGQFLVSGDGTGSVFIWDFKKHKILQKYHAHTGGPAICCVWHPLEPSVVFTCGWDGIIKMWQ